MGGMGSGRPTGFGKETVETYRSIDVNRLYRDGCLKPGWSGGRHWIGKNGSIVSINLRSDINQLHLSYRVRISGGDGEDIVETIHIVRVPCRYGGSRPYFICPGVVNGIRCERRVVKLHGAGRYFLCRKCYNLAYSSQNEDELDRAMRRANKARHKLGGEFGLDAPFPSRPKGMWHTTYWKLCNKVITEEEEVEDRFAFRAMRLMGNANKRR